jgi:hypothetical protein
MPEQRDGVVVSDRDLYVKNRNRRTLEELLAYEDQWVAWSRDGSRMVAHDKDPVAVTQAVKGLGVDSEQVILEYIPMGGTVDLL